MFRFIIQAGLLVLSTAACIEPISLDSGWSSDRIDAGIETDANIRTDADPSDYFNYGMGEDTWRQYRDQQLILRRSLQERRAYSLGLRSNCGYCFAQARLYCAL